MQEGNDDGGCPEGLPARAELRGREACDAFDRLIGVRGASLGVRQYRFRIPSVYCADGVVGVALLTALRPQGWTSPDI